VATCRMGKGSFLSRGNKAESREAMSDVVFILGAGASADCGGPLMANFLDVALSLLLADRVRDKENEFRTVFRTIGKLQSVHSKAQLDLTNIESVFTVLELAGTIQAPILSGEQVTDAIAALKTLIVRTLEEKIEFPAGPRGEFLPTASYASFADLLISMRDKAEPRLSFSVITFNYDIALDMALLKRGMGPSYALDNIEENPRHAPLLKLHGSLNWATEKGTGNITPVDLSQFLRGINLIATNTKYRVPIGRAIQPYFQAHGIEVDPEPVIVPPSWNKAGHYSALSNVWATAASHLSKARYIFVLGYSLPLTDSFFRHLYALGSVGDDPLLAFRVYDPLPQKGPVDRRFARLLGPGARSRYEYVPMKFAAGIEHIRKSLRLPELHRSAWPIIPP
jgi:hypothetical protein